MGQSIDFIEEPFTVTIRRGNAILTWPSGLKRAVPLDVFRIEHARAGRALAEYDGRLADVVPFDGRKPDHAARS